MKLPISHVRSRISSSTLLSKNILAIRSLSSTCYTRSDIVNRNWSTTLGKRLAQAITVTGPVPVASYMRMCMTGDNDGYYSGALGLDRDQFGHKGDFVTSPMISQIFGELVGLFYIAEWINQGAPTKGLELYEFGPGRGQLIDDILRIMSKFSIFRHLETVHLLEASSELRQTQWKLICDPEHRLTENIDTGCFEGRLKRNPSIKVIWYSTIQQLPAPNPEYFPMVLAHEFFDTLPIHVFEGVEIAPPPETPEAKSRLEWRELLVSPAPPGATHASLRTHKLERDGPVPEFQLTRAPGPTRHSKILPYISERHRSRKPRVDLTMEVCPEADSYVADIASRIGGRAKHPKAKPSGAALIIDYGPPAGIPLKSIRGIKGHKRVSPFAEPGLVDISADVDFGAIVEAALGTSEGVEAHGPVYQCDFLKAMGLEMRLEQLRKKLPDAEYKNIEASVKRLVDERRDGMGRLYCFLAILPENNGNRKPVGFGGDVSV